MKGYFWRIFCGGWAETIIGLCSSSGMAEWNSTFCKVFLHYVIVIFRTVSLTQRKYTILLQFLPKYFTLFHIITHLFLSQIRKLNLKSWWCFDMFYYPTLIQQNVHTDLTCVWVPYKLKYMLFNAWRGRIHLFTICDLNETFIFMSKFSMEAWPQMKFKMLVQRKEGHMFSCQVPKRPKA